MKPETSATKKWNDAERNVVALAYAKSISVKGKSLTHDEHLTDALKVLPENRRRTVTSLSNERVKLRARGFELLELEESEKIQKITKVAESPIITAVSALPVRPVRITPISSVSSETPVTKSPKAWLQGIEDNLANFVRTEIPDMLKRITQNIEKDLESEMKAQVIAAIRHGKQGVHIEFFPREFDTNDHSELPSTGKAVAVVTPVKPRTINIAVIGLLDRQVSFIKNEFIRENIFFRFLDGDNIRRVVKSSRNMDYIIVTGNFASHSLTDTIADKAGLKNKMRRVNGQITGIKDEINKILAEHNQGAV